MQHSLDVVRNNSKQKIFTGELIKGSSKVQKHMYVMWTWFELWLMKNIFQKL